MKLIDILIENNIQWPEGAEGVVQDYDGELKFFAGEEPTMDEIWLRDVAISKIIVDEVATDHNTAIITKQEWKCKMSKASKVNKPMFADVKVGDKVWDIHRGWGVVDDVKYISDYPVFVRFGGDSDSYTREGFCHADDINPSLFWDEIEIKAPPKPLPELEVDTKVIVWDSGEELKRHFSHFDEDGVMHTFYNGTTSFSSGGSSTTGWDNWKLAE